MGRPISLEAQMTTLVDRNKAGSFATHHKRMGILKDAAEILKEKFPGLQLKNLRLQHCLAVIETWKTREKKSGGVISTGTLKNQVAALRFACEALGKKGMLPAANEKLGIEERDGSCRKKSWDLSEKIDGLGQDDHEHRLHCELMASFGLRFKEAALLRGREVGAEATHLEVSKGTKGGRDRKVLITTPEQRDLLARLERHLAKTNQDCLIPQHIDWVTWRRSAYNAYEGAGMTFDAGGTPHGLRHDYAQRRYEALVRHLLTERQLPQQPWSAPCKQAPEQRAATWEQIRLNSELRRVDLTARRELTEELGHSRISITNTYLGRW